MNNFINKQITFQYFSTDLYINNYEFKFKFIADLLSSFIRKLTNFHLIVAGLNVIINFEVNFVVNS